MASLLLGSSVIYRNALKNRTSPQSVSKRRVCLGFVIAEKTSDDPIVVRRSGNYQPSVWRPDYILSLENKYATNNKVRERANILKEKVMKMLDETKGSFERLELIDTLQRFGISHHFKHEIDTILLEIYHENTKSFAEASKKENLYAMALEFRLLRQHGFNIPQDFFDNFKNHNNDVKGLLSLYEASYISTRLDIKLKEARTFATDRLREFVGKNIQSYEEESYMQEIVIHALEMPFHWRVSRLEARWYIDMYEKRHDHMNPILLEFAKLDFNITQAVHQEELKYVFRWWNNTGLATQLGFARDRITESYLWALTLFYEPQFGYQRQVIAKVNMFITIIDDFYDVYGTPEEHELFTTAIEKWDVNRLEQIPQNMRLCFLVLYNEVNQNGGDALRDKGFNAIPYLKEGWTNLCKSYLTEAKWYERGYKPSLEEYMENAWISISATTTLIHVFCMSTNSDQISPQTLNLILKDRHSIVGCAATILRLANDLATSPEEMARGDVPKSIQCYMHETGASEAEARAHVVQMISDTWDDLNHQIKTARSLSLPRHFVKTVINLARMGQYMYQYGDGHGRPDKTKTVDRVLSLLARPVPLNLTGF